MTDKPQATGKPAAVQSLNGRPVPGKPPIATPQAPLPRAIRGVFAQAPNAAAHGDVLNIGDKVTILNPHDPAHATGTIQLVSGDTPYGVLMDGMEQMGIHKWYTTDEIELVSGGGDQAGDNTAAKKKKPMKMEASERPSMSINGRLRPSAMPMPANRAVSALARPAVLEKWAADSAGIRAVESGDNVITMFGAIGEDYWSGGGITAKTVTAQLRAIGDRPIEVQINSPGGDMFEGIAIYNVLREHPQSVTIKIMGMAASAASVIAMAGDTVEIGAASFLMIHKCWVVAVGNEDDMRETADYLAPFDQAMAEVYAFRSGKTAAECVKWMKAETYMSGSVAIERGFADVLLASDKTTRDEQAKAADRERTAITALELKLVAGGDTRAQAREHITKIKGTPGAARDAVDTPGAADTELVGNLAGLLETIRS